MFFNVIAYRDIHDTLAKPGDNDDTRAKRRWQFIKYLVDPSSEGGGESFVEGVDRVSSFLDGLSVGGGGDLAEDVSGALLKV